MCANEGEGVGRPIPSLASIFLYKFFAAAQKPGIFHVPDQKEIPSTGLQTSLTERVSVKFKYLSVQ